MKYKIDSSLKRISANLKKLEIGFYLGLNDFSLELEENDFDDLWEHAENIQSKEEKFIDFSYIDYEKNTKILTIALNELLIKYKSTHNESYKDAFNDLIEIALLFCIEQINIKKDFSKMIEALEDLLLIEDETIERIEYLISNKKFNNLPNKIEFENKITVDLKKYQIFISSTYIDLKEERQAAVEAILKKGHIPAGMELFTAGNKSQWEVIKKWIDDSDIYLLILGGRYGSIDKKTGLSYTEMEYNYAIEKKKPLFALVLDDNIIFNKTLEITRDYDLKVQKYIDFKNVVLSNMSSFPKNIDQIKIEINHSLDTLISENKEKMQGWIKGN